MKRILCPTDFSDTAENAIVYAAKLATSLDAQLTLLNVQSAFDFTPAELTHGKAETIRAASLRLEAEALEVSKVFNVSCDSVIDPTYRKLSTVIDHEAASYDLIVMGSNGADDLYQFFNGSNTYHTMVKTNTPVLMIPSGYEYSEIKSVIYAYDCFRERMLPINPLISLVHTLKARVIALQVMEPAINPEAEEELMALQNSIKNVFAEDIELRFRTIHAENAAEAIHEYFLRSGGDVLALSTRHRNIVQRFFHKSVVKHITGIADYPVFVFH